MELNIKTPFYKKIINNNCNNESIERNYNEYKLFCIKTKIEKEISEEENKKLFKDIEYNYTNIQVENKYYINIKVKIQNKDFETQIKQIFNNIIMNDDDYCVIPSNLIINNNNISKSWIKSVIKDIKTLDKHKNKIIKSYINSSGIYLHLHFNNFNHIYNYINKQINKEIKYMYKIGVNNIVSNTNIINWNFINYNNNSYYPNWTNNSFANNKIDFIYNNLMLNNNYIRYTLFNNNNIIKHLISSELYYNNFKHYYINNFIYVLTYNLNDANIISSIINNTYVIDNYLLLYKLKSSDNFDLLKNKFKSLCPNSDLLIYLNNSSYFLSILFDKNCYNNILSIFYNI